MSRHGCNALPAGLTSLLLRHPSSALSGFDRGRQCIITPFFVVEERNTSRTSARSTVVVQSVRHQAQDPGLSRQARNSTELPVSASRPGSIGSGFDNSGMLASDSRCLHVLSTWSVRTWRQMQYLPSSIASRRVAAPPSSVCVTRRKSSSPVIRAEGVWYHMGPPGQLRAHDGLKWRFITRRPRRKDLGDGAVDKPVAKILFE
ncbi:uncharacterized protein THITE_109904 [Thermothielavioides terrestris NRRL 8126]|uniref:Uncharacterized protein n=1 Tax=Thermothielavioides terrestris (strain ATCC 38088 / NRRL 8126) TaxID=578455 RepID=G2R0Q4_THETT|nr:uncharacterized protein THITE_109904 [Thermothielavioides terrestris NRRL 8126]AEO67315.1 hypothetical protein THITE_109904 [Thermothielavioides terrestris NRRL 8126]